MKTVEALHAAKRLIEDPNNWTRLASGRDDEGRQVLANHPSAKRFCAYGAICRVVATQSFHVTAPLETLLNEAADTIRHGYGFIAVNDELGHDATLSMFDRAIELAKEQQ